MDDFVKKLLKALSSHTATAAFGRATPAKAKALQRISNTAQRAISQQNGAAPANMERIWHAVTFEELPVHTREALRATFNLCAAPASEEQQGVSPTPQPAWAFVLMADSIAAY